MIYLGWCDMIILHKCLFYALGVFLFLYHEKNEVCWCFIFLIWMNGCGPWSGVLMQFLFLWSFSLIYFASVWSKQVIRSSVLHWVGRNLNESGQLPFGFHMSFPKGTSWSPIVIKKKKAFACIKMNLISSRTICFLVVLSHRQNETFKQWKQETFLSGSDNNIRNLPRCQHASYLRVLHLVFLVLAPVCHSILLSKDSKSFT